jgi:hypothetical protein
MSKPKTPQTPDKSIRQKEGGLCPRCHDSRLTDTDIRLRRGVCCSCVAEEKQAEMRAKGLGCIEGEDDIYLFTEPTFKALEAAGFQFEIAETMAMQSEGGYLNKQRWGARWMMDIISCFWKTPSAELVAAIRAIAADPKKVEQITNTAEEGRDEYLEEFFSRWGFRMKGS